MIDAKHEIVGLDERRLGRIAEEIVRVADDELIERRRRGDQHGAGAARAAAGAAGALPGRSDRAGIAGEDGGVERADVDAELERAGRNHAANAALAQAALDLASFARKIAAAIAANRLRLRRRMWIGLFEISQQEFRVQAAVGENNGLQIAFQEFLRHARRLVDVAAANAEGAIHHRRVVEGERFFRGGRAIRGDDFHLRFDQPRGQIARIGNRGRAADELRLASVKSRNAAKPPQHVREVAAEDAAGAVQFVENDVAQVFKQAVPARVMLPDAAVQTSRVCQDDVALLANRFPRVAGSVAIVSEYAEAVCEPPAEVVKLGQLILRERLSWE